MIPKSINRDHVLQAIANIQAEGIPKKHKSTKFSLIHGGQSYPPILVFSLAAKYAYGEELTATEFSSGDESNFILKRLGFQIKTNWEDWSWKECYFAVWGYDQLNLEPGQVKEALYREIAELIGRNAGSIYYKIRNVSSFDPRPAEEKPIAEAKNAQILLGEVYQWYWADRQKARDFYNHYRDEFLFALEATTSVKPNLSTPQTLTIIEEGGTSTIPALRRKRSQKLLSEGRRYFRGLHKDGILQCQACGFSTPDGLDFEVIQLHHTNPIYEADFAGRRIPLLNALKSLVPLCPTCHALAHTSRPPLSVQAIKKLRESLQT
jgi:predicted HNH restriction endonuclease